MNSLCQKEAQLSQINRTSLRSENVHILILLEVRKSMHIVHIVNVNIVPINS